AVLPACRRFARTGAPWATWAPSGGRPWPRDTTTIPIPGDRDEALPGENPTSRLADELPFSIRAHAPPQLAGRPALLSQLKVLTPDAAAAVFGLLASHRADDAGGKPSLRRR